MNKPVKILLIVVLVLAATALLLLVLGAFDTRLESTHYDIETNKLKGSIKLALVTDLHSCNYGEGQKDIMDALEAEKPDAVMLGGDIVDDAMPEEKAWEFLDAVSNKYRCFYVTGNHEEWTGRADEIMSKISKRGITVLDNDAQTIDIMNTRLTIFGLRDPEFEPKGTVDSVLVDLTENNDMNTFTLLLSHRPELIATYYDFGFDLVLSGHAHGGQWRIPFLLPNGIISPGEGFFPEYTSGLYKYEDTTMIVSRGLARESTRLPRIWNRPELAFVRISGE